MTEIIEADGWYFTRQNGSHKQYCHSTKMELLQFPIMGNQLCSIILW